MIGIALSARNLHQAELLARHHSGLVGDGASDSTLWLTLGEIDDRARTRIRASQQTTSSPAGKAMSLTSWPTPSEYQDWSVEQLPVTLGDDSHLAIDDGDGGLIVDGVARQVKRGGPALRVG